MALFTVRPTRLDVLVANVIAAHTGPRAEKASEALTWGADEHVLCALAVGWWMYCRNKSIDQRRASGHVLLCTLAASVLPHVLKNVFDQERPDRLTVRGHWRGVPLSGKRLDAFPSGHAVHIGALASAASILPAYQRNLVWTIGCAIAATRVVLLAHWVSDTVAGLFVGIAIERLLRRVTGYGQSWPARHPPRKGTFST